VFVGQGTGYSNTTGQNNTFIGEYSGNGTTGSFNTFVGAATGYLVTSGAKNTIIGQYNGNQGGLDIRTSSNYIVLSDGDGNPRGVFDGAGNLLVGCTSLPGASVAGKALVVGSSGYYHSSCGATTTSYTHFYFTNGNGNVGTIVTNGSSTAFNTSSDYRLKENIAPMTGALAKVQALKPVTYKWKSDGSNGEGFIAHELAEVVAGCVTGEKDAVDAEGKPVYQGIDTSFLVATLTAAIQELKAEFDAYKASHP
jgi:hypothetical protein